MQRGCALSKFIQVNKSELFLIGGNSAKPSVLSEGVETSCLKIDLILGEYTRKAGLTTPRQAFGICLIGHVIYAVGGCNVN